MALFCWMLQCNVSVLPVIFKQHKSISNSQEVAYQRLHRNWNALWSSYPLHEKGGTNKSCKVTEKGWTRQTDENRPPRAPPHQHTVKQLWSPCLFVQNSHQPRSGRCGQKEEEIAVNLWVIENTYIPLCLHLYTPSSSLAPTFYTNTVLMEPPSPSCSPSPTGLNWCKRLCAHLLSGGEVTYLCSLLAVSCPTFSQLQVLMPSHCFPLCPGGVCGKIGGPLRCLMAFIDSHQTLQLPFSLCYAVKAF